MAEQQPKRRKAEAGSSEGEGGEGGAEGGGPSLVEAIEGSSGGGMGSFSAAFVAGSKLVVESEVVCW